jgi:hypothetical protein
MTIELNFDEQDFDEAMKINRCQISDTQLRKSEEYKGIFNRMSG